MGIFSSQNPTHEQNKYFDRINTQSHQTYDPYIQQGQQAGQQLGQQYGQMAQDPGAFYEQLMQGYQPSKQYQMQNDAQQRSAGNSAAAGGMRGTQQDIGNAAQISDRLMGDDMKQWYGNISGLMTAGQAGQQGMANRGYDAATGLGGDLNNIFGMQAGQAMQDARGHQDTRGRVFGGLMGAGAGAIQGGMTAGPWGAVAGGLYGGAKGSGFMK